MTAENHSHVIELHDVSKIYQIESQQVAALKGVSLNIPRGSILALTGPSGSGKSTLLHLMGTLDKPSGGKIVILGTDVSTLNDQNVSAFRNRTVGFVFQMNNLLPEFTALENVMMPGLIAQAHREKVRERAADLLNSVGLAKRLSHRPGELSGGEQQRVAIARALLMEPPILLADEPTGNLDRRSSESIQDLLMQLCDARGVTMIMVTHDMKLAAKLPQQVVLEDGMVIQSGGLG